MYYEDSHIKVYNKSCTDMSELEDNSIQCCVTSPPYWGLRKYDGNQEVQFSDGMASFGLEKTPELYVSHSIEILREIKRVLRPDGVVFWNIGDSYMSHAGDRNKVGGFQANPDKDRAVAESAMSMTKRTNKVLKDKDLCLIPFRVAIAAQEDGWWIRSVIIWNKPNPMPESVKDRPTDAYEHILMMTKSSRYYWDMEAVRESATSSFGKGIVDTPQKFADNIGNQAHSGWMCGDGNSRYLRNVWTFPTQPSPVRGVHFATFPEALPERCIKAATPEYGCCDKCGKPYERIVENKPMEIRRTDWGEKAGNRTASSGTMISPPETKTLGWKQSCKCKDSKPTQSTVLDPFTGSGTTLWVAKKLGRKAVGYELSEKYCNLIVDRNRQQVF